MHAATRHWDILFIMFWKMYTFSWEKRARSYVCKHLRHHHLEALRFPAGKPPTEASVCLMNDVRNDKGNIFTEAEYKPLVIVNKSLPNADNGRLEEVKVIRIITWALKKRPVQNQTTNQTRYIGRLLFVHVLWAVHAWTGKRSGAPSACFNYKYHIPSQAL